MGAGRWYIGRRNDRLLDSESTLRCIYHLVDDGILGSDLHFTELLVNWVRVRTLSSTSGHMTGNRLGVTSTIPLVGAMWAKNAHG